MSIRLNSSNPQIDRLIQYHPKEFESALSEVKDLVARICKSLTSKDNEIVKNLLTMNLPQISFIITEYAAFSQDAIHMLVDAMIRNHDWPKLFEELQNNINEEKGQETKGIPHLEIMREGYRKDLGIDVDYNSSSRSLITERFLDSMRKIFNNDDNAYSAGALIAFEGTAVEEFHILDAIVRKYKAGISNSDRALENFSKTLTAYYIDGHKEFEIGHEQHLIDCIRPYINFENIGRMLRGYLAVCLTMNTWWQQLYLESVHYRNTAYLANFQPQTTSVFKDIFGGELT